MFGLAAQFPPQYTGALILGNNVCGVIVALLDVIYRQIFSSKRTSAIYYFITAIAVLMICFDLYLAFMTNVNIALFV